MSGPWSRLDRRLDPYRDDDNVARVARLRRAPARPFRPAAALPARPAGLSIVILTLDKPELIIPLVGDLIALTPAFATRGLGYEVLIGDTGSTDAAVLDFYGRLPGPAARVVPGLVYHFSRCNNQVFFAHARFDTTLFLNNDVVIAANPGCLMAMRDHLAARPEAGLAGLCLYFADRTIQHAGIDFLRGGPLHGLCHHPRARERAAPDAGQPGWSVVPAVTGACLMIRSALFERLGGFDEDYASECQDVALCLAARRLGYRSDLLRAGQILHLENATRPRGAEDWGDRRRFLRQWGGFIDAVFLDPAPPIDATPS